MNQPALTALLASFAVSAGVSVEQGFAIARPLLDGCEPRTVDDYAALAHEAHRAGLVQAFHLEGRV